LVMLARVIWTRWRSDDALSPTGLSPRQLADPYLRSRDDLYASIDASVGDEGELPEDKESLSGPPSRVSEPRGSE